MTYPATWPHRWLLAAAALGLAAAAATAPAATPVLAQGKQLSPAKPEQPLAELPLYSADGKVIGKVIAVGLDEDNEPVLVAEIERRLGLGPTAVAVPLNMLVRKGSRLELTLTEAEVNARLGR